MALQEKATAVNEKANFERQLKQHRSQTQTLQTTLEKKDHVESKKRESILVVSIRLFEILDMGLSYCRGSCLTAMPAGLNKAMGTGMAFHAARLAACQAGKWACKCRDEPFGKGITATV